MKSGIKDNIESKATWRINKLRSNVVLRKDFDDLGSYRQVSRVINTLISKGKLVKIGQGVFAKSYISPYSSNPVIKGGFDTVSREALTRLKIDWEFCSAEQAYNNRQSTQIPGKNIVRLKTRCRRKIEYRKRKLFYEGEINAR